ncbi:MAG: STAS/SEC14 domain-containing protein [Chthoniobacterales bacterium]
MPVEMSYQPNDLCVLRVSGTWKRSELAAEQTEIARKIDAGARPRLLAILDKFDGWERGADWNDLDFLVSHSGGIAKIAIVAEPQWEVKALAFAGAGVRGAPVRFFQPNQLDKAELWIAE